MFTQDLFAEDADTQNFSTATPWRTHDCTYGDEFWREVIGNIWRMIDANPLHLKSHLVIVPDASMYVPFQAAWAAHVKSTGQPCIMPRMMTLLDWAKSAGASDVDMQRTERVLGWMMQLKATPQLAQWLGATEGAHLFAIAQSLIDMSDELSLHLLAGQDITEGSAALQAAVDKVFETNAGVFARQELDILLQCWRAEVSVGADMASPVLRYIQTLEQLIQTKPISNVWVVRNRPWAAFESWFWRAYARVAQVELLDVAVVRARVDGLQVARIHRAWKESSERIVPAHASESLAKTMPIIQKAENLEDEAQAVTRQVIEWQAQGVGKIALVALDRQVSRRVWALLARAGVAIRDDTGWLLATSRAASGWRAGLALWLGEVLAHDLLEWLAHPMVLADKTTVEKRLIIRYVHDLALRQKKSGQSTLARSWSDWRDLARDCEVSAEIMAQAEEISFDVRQSVITLFGQALNIQAAWRRTFSLKQWAGNINEWATQFGMLNAWQNDPAGIVWLRLLEKWRCTTVKTPLDLATFLCIADSEVEATTFRPHDVSDEVLLLPLGSTRMRQFDAVWLMGADAANLPSAASDMGLLNMAVRTQLGLPTHLDAQMQTKRDLIDLFATTPRLIASYCEKKDGSPNAISAWLAQWLRTGKGENTAAKAVELNATALTPTIQPRSQVAIAKHVPVEVSASDLSKLAACPYQYYAQQVLKARLYELPSDDISPADKGNLWHSVIAQFHEKRKPLYSSETYTIESDIAQLTHIIHNEFEPLCLDNARYWAVREQFISYVEAYVTWWRAREADDWQVVQSEAWQPRAYGVGVKTGHETIVKPLLWKGKIDQIDQRERIDPVSGEVQTERAVIDYKTGSVGHYAKSIKNNDDVQLAFYLNLFDEQQRAQFTQAGYVGVSSEPVKSRTKEKMHEGDTYYPQAWLNPSMNPTENQALQTAAAQLHAQVDDGFQRMYAGEPLQALGELNTCAWCDVRGLCRKGYTV